MKSISSYPLLPHKIISDNGPCSESKAFMDINRFVHIRSAPYHPNGL